MTIPFASFPPTIRTPGIGIEFDSSKSRLGPTLKKFRVLLIGFRSTAGSVAEKVLKQLSSPDNALDYFGRASQLHHMSRAFFAQGLTVECWGMGLNEEAGGTATVKRVAVAGPSTAAGTIALYIGGRRVRTSVASGDTAATIATAIAAAVNADLDLPVTAVVATSVNVDLTYRHKGVTGDNLDVRHSYAQDEKLPAGVTLTITQTVAGATDPDFATEAIFAAIGEQQFDFFVFGLGNDSTNRTTVDTELESRWGPTRANDGQAVWGFEGTHSAATTLGATLNSKHLTMMPFEKGLTPTWEVAAALTGQVAATAQGDPAVHYGTLPLVGVLAPLEGDRFTRAEQDLLLYDGMSTWVVDQGGTVRISRVITTWQKNAAGADDVAFLDLFSKITLSYMRYDLNARWATKYSRHKLAGDGTKFGPGQKVMTPGLARAETIAVFRTWEELGLVEDFDQFKADILAERNAIDPNRLDLQLSPNLINNLLVTGVKLAFLL